jgi:hypothetical protein
MAEKLPLSSERKQMLDRWILLLHENGHTVTEKLDSNPTSASGLEELLNYSHAPAARALATQKVPVIRTRILPSGQFKRGSDSRVLRLSFGFLTPSGDCQMKRVTIYQVEPLGIVAALTGTDSFCEGLYKTFQPWDGIDPKPSRDLRSRVEIVLTELQHWYAGFQNSRDFLMWWGRTSSQYTEERRQLSVMYADYSLTQPFGLKEEPTGFRPALDDEYRRRLLDLVERYQGAFRAIPLNAAEIRCSILSSKSGSVRLPFLAEPLLFRK